MFDASLDALNIPTIAVPRYSYEMSIPYVGSSSLTTTIQIPQDLDNADAASVNISSKAEIDNQVALLTAYGQLMSSTCPIRVESTGATTLTVAPIPHAFVQEGGSWKVVSTSVTTNLTAADVEGGGGFVGPNWYYIYISSMGGLPIFQISLTPPDGYYLYKNGSFAYKFIGSINFNGVFIEPFLKYDGVVVYRSAALAIGSGTNITITSLASNTRIPPTSRIGKFSVLVNTTSGGSGGELRFYPNGAPTEYLSFIYPGNNLLNMVFDCAVKNTQEVFYSVPVTIGPTAMTYFCLGYYE